MVEIEIEMINFSDLRQLKIEGYKLEDNVIYNTETVSYVDVNNEDNYITITMVPEFDQFGFESGRKGILVEITKKCAIIEVMHFSPNVSWNALQAFFDRNFSTFKRKI